MTYSGKRWQQAREAAMVRDNSRCQSCGTRESLHAHHIKPVKEFDSEQDAHYVENLVILCKRCHGIWEGKKERPKLAIADRGITVNEIAHSLAADTLYRCAIGAALPEIYYLWTMFNPGICSQCLRQFDEGNIQHPNFESLSNIVHYIADAHDSPICSRESQISFSVTTCTDCVIENDMNSRRANKADLIHNYFKRFSIEFDYTIMKDVLLNRGFSSERRSEADAIIYSICAASKLKYFDDMQTSQSKYRKFCDIDEGFVPGNKDRDKVDYLNWYRDEVMD